MRAATTNALARLAVRRAQRFAALMALTCCGSEGQGRPDSAAGPVAECSVKVPTACPEPAVRYADVEPLIASKCVSCHYGALGGPWPLTTYDDAADWKDTIRDDVLDCSMPPPDSGVTLSDDERLSLLSWVRCGGIE